jgi:hypothetical protein
MSRIRLIMLSLLAVFALSAVAATSASAHEPTWWVCQKGTAENKEFTDHTCTTLKAGGGWIEKELSLATEKFEFVSKHKAGAVHKLIGTVFSIKIEIECTEEKDKGEIIGGRPGTDTVTGDEFTGCKVITPAGCLVHSPGKTAGNIALEVPLTTKLVWKHGTGKVAEEEEALDILKSNATTGRFARLVFENETGKTCPLPKEVNVINEVLAEVKPVAKMAVVGELIFPCPPILKYWTGDISSKRAEHTIKQLELEEVGGLKVKGKVEFCETKEVELSGTAAGWAFGVFPAEKTLG